MGRIINLELMLKEDNEDLRLLELPDKENIFQTEDGSIIIKVESDKESGGKRVHLERCANRYKTYQQMLLGLFETKYEEILREQRENYESGFENSEEEQEADIKVPYDPQLITVAPAKFSLKEIVGMIDGEDDDPVLDLAPDFQRDYVWDNTRKSRLIESILLNIPLPVFYLARDKDGKMQVVDGVQRLTTIYKYFKNDFKLSHLEYLKKECDGRYFKNEDVSEEKNLRPKLVRALRQYQIDCNIIEPSTPENVKLDIFKRLNTGGKELNKQEVRHAFMRKEVRDFVKELVTSREFLDATDSSVNDKRMMAQELILRYIGFFCLYINNFLKLEYSTKMDDFIDDVAVGLNCCKNIPYEQIRKCFFDAMKNSHLMFGKRAFRKIDLDENGIALDKKNPINKSLFVTFSIQLSFYPKEMIAKKGNVCQKFAEFLNSDNDFYYSISHNTNYQLRETAMKKVAAFLENLYGAGKEIRND